LGKTKRGKPARVAENWKRGECPLCHRSGVKLLWERNIDGNPVSVCKICSNPASKLPDPEYVANR
jgi:hypothetical protein